MHKNNFHLKPVEPGCLALVINNPVQANNGRVVKVIRLLGDNVIDSLGRLPRQGTNDWWQLDRPIITRGTHTDRMGEVYAAREYQLMRIDDFNDEQAPTQTQTTVESLQRTSCY